MKFETSSISLREGIGTKKKRRCPTWTWRTERILFILLFLSVSLAHSQSSLKIPLYIHQKEIWVEVAKTPEERNHGLMGPKRLNKDEGMLFIFETGDYHGFCMKDTLILLSLAFIDRDGRIAWITDMKPQKLDSHVPPRTILDALEMNKGWFSSHGIKAGDIVKFSK
jgi:hypothetical protein